MKHPCMAMCVGNKRNGDKNEVWEVGGAPEGGGGKGRGGEKG